MVGQTSCDVAIAGAGIIGLALGLELLGRRYSVTVVERDTAMCGASSAAGGMLAVQDPQNPAVLMPLCLRSAELYPAFLDRIERLSGLKVPVRTHWTMQHVDRLRPGATLTSEAQVREFAPGMQMGQTIYEWLQEGSLDPKDLRAALPKAFVAAGGILLEHTAVLSADPRAGTMHVRTSKGTLSAADFVNCCGSWAAQSGLGPERLPVVPVKGQMVDLRCAPERLRCVVRAPGIYMIPRGDGRVTTGSTLEHAGFDTHVNEQTISGIGSAARSLLPEIEITPEGERWAGLRPGTPDLLPVLGGSEDGHCWHATGHYRDGILLAPGTARVMAQAIAGEQPDVAIEPFRPGRFAAVPR